MDDSISCVCMESLRLETWKGRKRVKYVTRCIHNEIK